MSTIVAALALVAYVPDHFETVSHDTFERVCVEVETAAAAAKAAAKEAKQQAAAAQGQVQTSGSDAPARPRHPDDTAAWKEWRARAVAALRLEDVYGDLLTGEDSGNGWRQARDPASPTGDRSPSAGVADGTGEAERGSFHSFRTGETVSVFDFLQRHRGCATFIAAAREVARWAGLPTPPPASVPTPTGTEPNPDYVTDAPGADAGSSGGGGGADWSTPIQRSQRPTINICNRQLDAIVSDAWTAIRQINTRDPARPWLFLRGRSLVRLVADEHGPVIEYMIERDAYDLLHRIATWVKATTEATFNALPLKEVARSLISTPQSLPRLESVVTMPVFDAAGHLVDRPGYHPEARLWYHRPEELTWDEVPESPTTQDVAAARALLFDELLVDFPFALESDRCHAVCAFLLPFVRRMIPGPTPLHLIEAPTPGAGKSLLADLISIVAVGRPCEATTMGKEEEETRKNITSVLLKGGPINLIDNVSDKIASGKLAKVLTDTTWSDRVLGSMQMVDLPVRCLWLATSNNPTMTKELARRCARVRIDPHMERPWERQQFKHQKIRIWTREHRPALLRAVLVLIRAWIAAGKPEGGRLLGSYDDWSAVMGGICDVTGIPGFLGNCEELYSAADLEGEQWRAFVAAWWAEYKNEPIGCKMLCEFAVKRDLLLDVLGDKSERSQQSRLGRALAKYQGCKFGELCIGTCRDKHTHLTLYQLEGEGSVTATTGTGASSTDVTAGWGDETYAEDGED